MIDDDLAARLDRHRREAGPALAVALMDGELPTDRNVLAALGVLVVDEHVDIERPSALLELLGEQLSGRSLPWDEEDVCLALQLASQADQPTYLPLRTAVRMAEQYLRQHPGAMRAVAELRRVDRLLSRDRLHSSEFFRAKLHPMVRRLVAANAPAGLVDLTVIDTSDRWGPAARDVADRLAEGWSDAAGAVNLLAEPRGGRPSRAWRERAEALAGDDTFRALVRGWLELVADAGLTTADPAVHGWDVPERFLLTASNVILVRAAVWSCGWIDEDWVVPALEATVARTAVEVRGPDGPIAMHAKVALAGADVLCDIPGTQPVRRRLMDQVTRPDVRRRLGIA